MCEGIRESKSVHVIKRKKERHGENNEFVKENQKELVNTPNKETNKLTKT